MTSRTDVWTCIAQVVESTSSRGRRASRFSAAGCRYPEEDANQLADRLDDLPLALEQAAAWQAETRTSAGDYLRLFDERLAQLQELEAIRTGVLRADYPLPVAVTWSLALDKLRETQPEVVSLLQLCAYFAPEPIPWNVLSVGRFVETLPEGLRHALSSNRERDRMIREIKKYALAQVDYGNNRLQLHRLAQLVLREQLSGQDEREEVRHQAHMLIAAADPATRTYRTTGNAIATSGHTWSRAAPWSAYTGRSGKRSSTWPVISTSRAATTPARRSRRSHCAGGSRRFRPRTRPRSS